LLISKQIRFCTIKIPLLKLQGKKRQRLSVNVYIFLLPVRPLGTVYRRRYDISTLTYNYSTNRNYICWSFTNF